jgi:hypothetical protein
MSAGRLILILLLLPALLPSPAWSTPQTADMLVDLAEDLTCIVKLPFDAAPRTYSCSPILFEFTNDGADRMIRVEVSADGNWSGVFSVPGGKTSRGFIYLPCTSYMTSNDIVFYDLETGEELKRTRGPASRGGRGSRDVFILTVAEGDPPQVANDFCTSSDVRFGTVSPERLPDSWIGLTGVDALIVPHETWASSVMKIEPTLDWIVMGGNCLIVDVPGEAREAVIRDLESKGALARVTNLYQGGVGMGAVLKMGAGEVRFIERETLLESDYYVGPPCTARNYSAGKGSPRRPELNQLEGPPFLPVLFFLLVFSVLVGPVGWWYAVGRKGQPLIYFVLAPSLSACVVVIIIAVDFLNQGVTPRAALIATEVIDQTTQRRITLSQFALYFPFSIGRSLEGDFNELPHFLSVQNNSRAGYNLRGLTAAPTEKGMKYGGTALPARRTSWYAREKIRPERRRLLIWKEEGKILVENHLGMAIRHLLLCCDGTYAALDRPLAEGERLEAKAVDQGAAMAAYENFSPEHRERAVFHPLVIAFSNQWCASFKEGRNTYAAERSSGFEELLWVDHADVEDSTALLLGIF